MSVTIGKLVGVESVEVSLNEGLASVEFNHSNEVTLQQLRQAIRDQGFSARQAKVVISATIEARAGRLVAVLPGPGATFTLDGDAATLEEVGRASGSVVLLRGSVAADDRNGATPTVMIVEGLGEG